MGALLQAGAELPGGYGWMLLEAVLALAGVLVLAWVVLRWLAERGLGGAASATGRVRVIERVPLDARRSLVLVEVGGRVLLLGLGDGAAPALVTEIDAATLPPLPTRGARSFREAMRALGVRREDAERARASTAETPR